MANCERAANKSDITAVYESGVESPESANQSLVSSLFSDAEQVLRAFQINLSVRNGGRRGGWFAEVALAKQFEFVAGFDNPRWPGAGVINPAIRCGEGAGV